MRRVTHIGGAVVALALLTTGTPQAIVPIPPGLDLLETDPATTFQDLQLPPGALLPFCDGGFVGRVPLRGEPFDCFGITCGLFPTDTIVRRLAPANPPVAIIPIEIVALELRSIDPIIVNCTGGPQAWNMSASVPEGDPNQSPGNMQIQHFFPDGGTFTSSLPVRPMVTFTRVSDNATVGPSLVPQIVFNVGSAQWCHTGNPLDDPVGDVVVSYDNSVNFFPGILCPDSPGSGGERRKMLTVEQAAQAAHGILPAEKKHHYKCFDINGPPVNQSVTLSDQFGTQTVQVLEPVYLCPPAKKNNQYGNLESPHLKCYNIFGQDPGDSVRLKSQFGLEPNVSVGQARMLCTPVKKGVVFPVPHPPPAGPLPESPQYTCYEIGGPPPGVTATILTQFGNEPNVPIGPPRFLCAPSIKNNNDGSLKEPHLKCYNIFGTDPPHIVNLQSQFGLEFNVPVGRAELFCIPVKKTRLVPGLSPQAAVLLGTLLLLVAVALLYRLRSRRRIATA